MAGIESMSALEEVSTPFADLTLSRRLERAEGHSNARFVEARAELFPDRKAKWTEVAGTFAMFDGPDSPVTQTFGLGLFQTITHAEMESIEAFYGEFNSPVCHEVSPLVDLSLVHLLVERGYRPMEFTTVLFRPIRKEVKLSTPRNKKIRVRLVSENEREIWAETSARGWGEHTEFASSMYEFARVSAAQSDGFSFIAEIDGRPIATGELIMHEGVALLAGASTILEARQQGAQLALLESRLQYAADQRCDIAMMCALPGSSSQRNAERQGFRIAYTRIKWQLAKNA
jgi:hypothetical protein